MNPLKVTLLLILLSVCASAQIDTAQMILGDWFYNNGDKFNLKVDQEISFSRQHTNDSLYLHWKFKENDQFVRSGAHLKDGYPVGFKSKSVRYYLTKGKSTIYFNRKSYRIITLNKESLIVIRIE